MSKTIDLAEVGPGLSDAIESALSEGQRVLLYRGTAPVAVVLSPAALAEIEGVPDLHPESLAGIVGEWEGFSEIEPFIEEVYRDRQKEMGRPIDLD